MQSTKNPNQTFDTITNTQYPHFSRVYHTTRLKQTGALAYFSFAGHPRLMRTYRKIAGPRPRKRSD
jgi:hypothetical protein